MYSLVDSKLQCRSKWRCIKHKVHCICFDKDSLLVSFNLTGCFIWLNVVYACNCNAYSTWNIDHGRWDKRLPGLVNAVFFCVIQTRQEKSYMHSLTMTIFRCYIKFSGIFLWKSVLWYMFQIVTWKLLILLVLWLITYIYSWH